MKIGLVFDTTFDSDAGVQQYFKGLAKYLLVHGHDIRFLVPKSSREGEFKGKIIQFGSSINPVGNVTSVPISFFVGGRKRIKEVLRKERFDIIHIGAPFSPFLGAKIVELCNCPVVSTYLVHTKNSIYKLGAKILGVFLLKAYRKIDAHLAISEVSKAEACVVIPGDYNVIPIGVDTAKYSSKAKPIKKFSDGKSNILFLGRLEERKGCEYLIRAFNKVRSKVRNSRLIIAGDGPLRKQLEALVKKLKLEGVVFEGYIDEKLKHRYYASADLCVFPAIHGESFGVVLIEAMASGKVTLAFANEGYKFVLRNISQLIVPNRNTGELAKRIEEFLLDKKLRRKYEAKCLREAKKYGWEAVGLEILKIYEDLLVRA
ncbi:glycosyltransferase family 4 protein [Candidatus Dojkabacteria bacterium]|nr:glycosyltransferase family 4 protein [Candidatus Dojkabacteria bacterium]